MAIIDPCDLGPALPSGVNPAFIYTRYPEDLDDPRPFDADGLPVIVDLQTPVRAESLNRHRESILAIEGELGLQPSGTFTTVRDRLDAIEEALCMLWNNVRIYVFQDALSLTGDLPVRELNFTGSVSISQDIDFANNGRVNIEVAGGAGSQGPQGNQGNQGVIGAGTQGVQGNQGTTGAQGNQGNQGLTGSGNQGVAGVQGNQGNQGVGVQGTQGVQGFRGFQGSIGFQGNQGAQGQGNQGNQGNQGVGSMPYVALVANYGDDNVTPLRWDESVWVPGINVSVGTVRYGVAITSDGLYAIVTNRDSNNITPLTRNGNEWISGTVVSVGTSPVDVAITPDRLHAIVVNTNSDNITPLTWNGSVWIAGTAVSVGTDPTRAAIVSDGYGIRAIITNWSSNNITPLTWDGSVWVAGSAVSVGTNPTGVAITPDGYRAIVTNSNTGDVTPLIWDGSVWVPGSVVSVGITPANVAITSDGLRAIVANRGSNTIMPLTWNGSVWVPGTVVSVGTSPADVAITPDGLNAIVANFGSDNITPLTWDGSTWVAGTAVSGGMYPYSVAITQSNYGTVGPRGAQGNQGNQGPQGIQAFAGIGDANTVYWSNGVANSWSGEPTVTGVNAFQYIAIGTTGFNPSLVFTNTSVTPIIFQNFKSVSGDAEPLLIQAQCNSNANGNGGDLKLMGGFGIQSHGDVILQTPSSDTIGAGANNITFSKATYGSTVQSSYQKLVAVNNSGYGSCALAPMAYGQTSPYPRCDKYFGTFGLVGPSHTYTIKFSKTIHGYSPLNSSSLTGKMLLGWTGNNGEFVSGGAALEFLVSIFIGTIGDITQGWTSLDGTVPSIDPTIANGWLSLNKNTVPGGVSGVVPDMPEVTLTYNGDEFMLTIRAPSNDVGTLALFYWQFEYGGIFS